MKIAGREKRLKVGKLSRRFDADTILDLSWHNPVVFLFLLSPRDSFTTSLHKDVEKTY